MLEETPTKKTPQKYYDNVSIGNRTKQIVYICKQEDKASMLEHYLVSNDKKQCIVLVKSKKRADELTIYFNSKHIKTIAVHGNHRKEQIDKGALEFNEQNITLLITTDKILHSLELKDLKTIINYDLPSEYEEYFSSLMLVDEVGESISFVSNEEDNYLAIIEMRQKNEIKQELLEGFTPTNSTIHKVNTKMKKPRHRNRKTKKVYKEEEE